MLTLYSLCGLSNDKVAEINTLHRIVPSPRYIYTEEALQFIFYFLVLRFAKTLKFPKYALTKERGCGVQVFEHFRQPVYIRL